MRSSVLATYRNHGEALLAGAAGFAATAMAMLALSIFFA